MMAAYALRPLLLYLHLYAQLVARKPALDDPHTKLLPAALERTGSQRGHVIIILPGCSTTIIIV